MLIKNFWEIVNKNKLDLVQIPTRKGFGEGLLLAGKNNLNVVALSADLTDSTQVELFKKAFPDRFFEMGVAEQNMASVASGMAHMGKTPFITSYAMFSPGRNWEQIRTTISYNNVPVKIVGCHAGVSVGPDGGTHQALEDIGLMRMLPNMVVVVPCDAIESKKATLAVAQNNLPSYLRLFREKSPVITEEGSYFKIGEANVMYETNKSFIENSLQEYDKDLKRICIIANGEMVSRALFCVKEIEKKGYEVAVINMHTIQPLDKNVLSFFCEKYKNVLVAEEHQVAGGMGSAILEYLAESKNLKNLNFKILGVKNRFGQSGTKEELFEEYGLNEKHILKNALEMLE